MSDTTTIARPYAKAIFELALEAGQLADWSGVLETIANVAVLPESIQFINNPVTTLDEQVQLVASITARVKTGIDARLIDSYIILLATNKRLLLAPAIFVQYELLRAEQEKTLIAKVTSFSPLSDAQQRDLIEKLTQRLQRRVSLELKLDSSLLGGAKIEAGGLVIDGSVRGQLEKLASSLAA